jgi:ribosomal protein S27E
MTTSTTSLLQTINFFDTNIDRPVEESDLIYCEDCEQHVPVVKWEETEIGCELCGEHSGIRCTECFNALDFIFDRVEVRREAQDDSH